MRPAVAARLQLTAAVLQEFVRNRGLLPLDDKTLATYAWRIMGRQAGVAVAFQVIEWGVLACCALGAATLLGLDPVRGTAALLAIRFLVAGISVKKSAAATQRRVLTATLEEACSKSKPDPDAPRSITEALEQIAARAAKERDRDGEKR